MAISSNHQDLIDSPVETLEVEYKSWLDIATNEAKADLARHIGAIANHGGGMIVFGFDDDMKVTQPSPYIEGLYTRDTVSGVVKKYLEPAFQCNVEVIESSGGTKHPVIFVPSHENVPICAKSSGPHVDGKPKGIQQGVHYTRKPGPESAPIQSAAEWAPIIRRCALHDRNAILRAIDASLARPAEDIDRGKLLEIWHDAANKAFEKYVPEFDAPREIIKRHLQFSYSILRGDGQVLDYKTLKDSLLLQMHNEVTEEIKSGWSMFYPFTRKPIDPYFMSDPDIGDVDFMEAVIFREKHDRRYFTNEMWRISPDARATVIRPYWEDDPSYLNQFGLTPGTIFTPRNHAKFIGELVRHARAFGEKFDMPVIVNFRCEWRGLMGREIGDPQSIFSFGGKAPIDRRVTTKEVPFISLTESWADIVCDLLAPVVRIFNGSWHVTPDWVRSQSQKW